MFLDILNLNHLTVTPRKKQSLPDNTTADKLMWDTVDHRRKRNY